MSRSGYVDDIEDKWRYICWRGAVNSAIKGKRGQAFLKELIAALDSMPNKALSANSLVTPSGEYCTLGAIGAARGIKLSQIDPEDCEQVAEVFGIAEAMVREIVFENDEAFDDYEWVHVEVCGPMPTRWSQAHCRSVRVYKQNAAELRWTYMRKWAESQLNKEQP